jgi:hypothetical protein
MDSKLLYEHVTTVRTKHRLTKEKLDRPTPMKAEQALNGLHPAVADDGD